MARCDSAPAGLALSGDGLQERGHWLLALGVSLALHGMLLATRMGGKPPVSLPLPLRVQLVPVGGVEGVVASGVAAAPRRAPVLPRAVGVSRERADSGLHSAPLDDAVEGPPAGPRINLEAARALARGGYGSPAGKDGGRAAAEAAPALSDRPALPAMAQRLGRPAGIASETMVGGSRLIRFRDGRCLQIPVDVPAWRESQVVPTEWAASNCPP